MKLNPRIRRELMRRAGKDARALQMWKAYIMFLEACPQLAEHTPGTAIHHILWRSEYPRYKKYGWNLIRLSHEDHTAASALMLGAEPNNAGLFYGFGIASRIIDRAWAPQNADEIVRRYIKDHWPVRRIAKRWGVSDPTIRRLLLRHGVIIRDLGSSHLWEPTECIGKEAIRLYLSGMNMSRIAAKFSVSYHTARHFFRRRGIAIRSISESKRMRLTNQKASKIESLYLNGWGSTRIAKRYRVSQGFILLFLKRRGIARRSCRDAARLRVKS